MDLHSWIDIASIGGLLASTIVGVLLANRLSQHQALEKAIDDIKQRVARLEGFLGRAFKF